MIENTMIGNLRSYTMKLFLISSSEYGEKLSVQSRATKDFSVKREDHNLEYQSFKEDERRNDSYANR